MKNLILLFVLSLVLIPEQSSAWCFKRANGSKKLCNSGYIPITINALEVGAATDGNTFTPHLAEKAFFRKLSVTSFVKGEFTWGSTCSDSSTWRADKLKCLKKGTHIRYNKNCKSKKSNWCKKKYGKGFKCREHWYDDGWKSSCFKTK